jgi:rhodanese-related sulfurtransferase
VNAPSRLTSTVITPVTILTALALALAACSTSSGTAAGTSTGAPMSGTAASVPAAQGPQASQHLDVTGFAALTATPGTVVLDVRTPEEFSAGHLAGARNLDIRAADFQTRISALDRGSTYAVYCHSGNRSGQALQMMTAAGFTHVTDLSGGITAWAAAGKPVTTS